ncbi:hypothetical protein SSYIS1_29730 [Serratia symbiotica]|uniref:Uncharacterized protein n=1 Tax=Serratia symbiotica TaxID=138074 RepID=A0A455VN53_9GAMM|nr:hypothetical protein SSYIS1_29730 [Serratia symbiotica]
MIFEMDQQFFIFSVYHCLTERYLLAAGDSLLVPHTPCTIPFDSLHSGK